MATNYTIAGTLFLRRSNAAALSASFYDSAGVIADPGTVTVTITRQSDGSAVATAAATTGTGAAARAYTLSAVHTADLDVLTVVWSGTISAAAVTITQECEVIGDWLFTIAEARAAHPDLLEATYPDATIQAIRERITEWFAEICGVSFVERFRRVVVSGDGTAELLLPEAMRVSALRRAEERTSGTQTWTALSAGDLADVLVEPIGLLVRETIGTWTAGRGLASISKRAGQGTRVGKPWWGYRHGGNRPRPRQPRHPRRVGTGGRRPAGPAGAAGNTAAAGHETTLAAG